MNTNLPIPPVPADFDDQVFTRIWLATLPSATPPNDLGGVLPGNAVTIRLWMLNLLIFSIALAAGLWLATRNHIVTVLFVPDIRSTYTNLYAIPPAPATEDVRWKQLSNTTGSAKKLVGRAGY